MRVTLNTEFFRNDVPDRLFLEPESDADRELLATLCDRYALTNFGGDPDSGAPLHVGLALHAVGTITALLTPSEDGGFTAEISGRPGCISEGDTIPEALRNLAEAVELYEEAE